MKPIGYGERGIMKWRLLPVMLLGAAAVVLALACDSSSVASPPPQQIANPSLEGNIIQPAPNKGETVTIAGVEIHLPEDAYIDYFISKARCLPGGTCARLPWVVIRRGESKIFVSIPTGVIDREIISSGEEGAFDFLKGALP